MHMIHSEMIHLHIVDEVIMTRYRCHKAYIIVAGLRNIQALPV